MFEYVTCRICPSSPCLKKDICNKRKTQSKDVLTHMQQFYVGIKVQRYINKNCKKYIWDYLMTHPSNLSVSSSTLSLCIFAFIYFTDFHWKWHVSWLLNCGSCFVRMFCSRAALTQSLAALPRMRIVLQLDFCSISCIQVELTSSDWKRAKPLRISHFHIQSNCLSYLQKHIVVKCELGTGTDTVHNAIWNC